MKKYLLALLIVFTLAPAQMNSAPHHRHNPAVSVTMNSNGSMNVKTDSVTVGTDAYSDTSSVDTADYDNDSYVGNNHQTDDEKFALQVLDKVFGSASFGVVAALGLIFAILLVLLPIILLIVFLRYLFKRHNDRVVLEQQAIAAGQPLKQPEPKVKVYTNELQWQKGIKNVALGVGLFFFFWILGAKPIMGIGILVACLGGGQIMMARHTLQNDQQNPGNNAGASGNNQQSFNGNVNQPKNDNQTPNTGEQD